MPEIEIGARFGAVVVLEFLSGAEVGRPNDGGHARLRCDCGRRILVRTRHLRAGAHRTCGMAACLLRAEQAVVRLGPAAATPRSSAGKVAGCTGLEPVQNDGLTQPVDENIARNTAILHGRRGAKAANDAKKRRLPGPNGPSRPEAPVNAGESTRRRR